MSTEKGKGDILRMPSILPTVEVQPHPKEILELDEETIAIGRAKLSGIEFDEIYGQEDRISPEFLIRHQAQKIRELFQTPEQLRVAFSSPQRTEQAIKDMAIDGIDLNFVKSYCVRSNIAFENDTDALLIVGFSPSGECNV